VAHLTQRIRCALFAISPREVTFARRAFVPGAPETVTHLEHIGQMFLAGYNTAVTHGTPNALMSRLSAVPLSHQGFAVEGAAFAFALLDRLAPWRRNRFRVLLRTAADHPYMAHIGAGWALARLGLARFRSTRSRALARMDPILRWLVIDGYGFHEGYFRRHRAVTEQWEPAEPTSYVCRAFHQGLGRSLWFRECADPARIRAAIFRFPEHRRSDLWSGVGLACAYAGGVSDTAIASIGEYGAAYAAHIAQGVAFAAKARLRARNLVEHTNRACHILCGIDAAEAAAVTDRCLVGLSDTLRVPAFELWRRRIAAHVADAARIPQPMA
jgi:hypothetical protein